MISIISRFINRKKLAAHNKILCCFYPSSIKDVPLQKTGEYLQNCNKYGVGYWTELLIPDKGYVTNLNNETYSTILDFLDNKNRLHYKVNLPQPLKR